MPFLKYAPVAQLDRVSVSEAEGRGFDSRRAHQISTYGHVSNSQIILPEISRDQLVTISWLTCDQEIVLVNIRMFDWLLLSVTSRQGFLPI